MVEDLSRTLPPPGTTSSVEPSLADTNAYPARRAEIRPLRAGDHLGRYVILEQIGRGGMSIVYAAYDPQLDRRVAIKVLLPHRAVGVKASTARSRLLREAQAMAQLSHPNVIAVHDVGVQDDQVFLAMEFVAGVDLKKWQARSRPTPETIAVYVQAGRGLLAAHRAGLVHRDFKPDNVLLGDDGRVRVVDFGLVHTRADSASKASDVLLPAPGADVTRTGALVGTPAYMSPEQFGGARGDERSDQFSFCVALFEALFGQRPFGGDDLPSIARTVTSGKIEIPTGRTVSGAVVRVLRRGLSADPAERYPTMGELLDELTDDPGARRRRRMIAGFAAIGVVGVGALAYQAADPSVADVCHGGAERRAQVWSEARQAKMRAAFEATGVQLADDAWTRTSKIVGDHLDGWQTEYDAACRRTRVEQTQSEELLGLQHACLDDHLRHVGILADVFEHANREVVFRAVERASQLGTLEQCRDTRMLRKRLRAPVDADVAVRVAEIRTEIDQARALSSMGRREEAAESLLALQARAEAIEYPPVQAEVAVARAGLSPPGTTVDEHIEAYVAAFDAALAADHDYAALQAASELVALYSMRRQGLQEGLAWARHAEALHERLGTSDAMRVALQVAWATLEGRECRLDTAVPRFERALARAEQAGDDYEISILYTNLGGVYAECRKFDEALPLLEKARALDIERYGVKHPVCLNSQANVATVALMMGDYEEAIGGLEEVMRLGKDTDWERMGMHLSSLSNLGRAYRLADRLDDADRISQEVVAEQKRFAGEDTVDYADALEARALVLEARGDTTTAVRHLRQGDEILARVDPRGLRRVRLMQQLVDTLQRAGDVPAAVALEAELVELVDREAAPSLYRRAVAELAGMYLDLGRDEDARASLARADDVPVQSDDEFTISEILVEFAKLRLGEYGPANSARAREVVVRLEALRTADPDVEAHLDRVEAWMRDHEP